MDKFLKDVSDKDCNDSYDENDETPNKRPKFGKSLVWDYFIKISNGKSAKCKKCGKIYSTSGNTTNLWKHLKLIHPNLTASEVGGTKASGSITSYFVDKYEPSSLRKKALDSAVTYFIASDLRPYSVVENKGFRHLLKTLDPRYELPSRTTFRDVHMHQLYTSMYAKLKNIVEKVDHCAITTDSWTSRANEAFLTVTCHFITEDFQLRTAVLSTKKLIDEENHSAENISKSLLGVLNEWGVLSKVTAIVTDNATNMKLACSMIKKTNLPCFAHTINLTVQDCLKSDKIKPIIIKCKSIVSFFKNSSVAYAKFKKAQNVDKPYNLKQECPTRWNSAFYMIQRILSTKDAIYSVLLNTPKALLPLSADEISILEELIQVLSPFEHATIYTSSSSSVTISMVIPVVCGIVHNLQNMKSKLATEEGNEACSILLEGLRRRLIPYETRSIPRISTLLDPRFKKEGYSLSYDMLVPIMRR